MRGRLPAQRHPWLISRAVLALREAPTSPCPSCGRVTKTTTDGMCADCWAQKAGPSTRLLSPPPRWALRLGDLVSLGRRRRR